MKHAAQFLSLLTLMLIVSVTGFAQTSTSRVEKQHEATAFMKKNLPHTEELIMRALTSPFENEGYNGPLQTVRDLEQLFPDHPFEKLIVPLQNILRNERVDPTSRMLAALALDELHSDEGDSSIKAMAENCENAGVQTLCRALLIKSKTD